MEEYDPFMETSVSWQMKFTVWASVASFVMSFVPAMAFVLIGDWGGYLDAWAIRKDTKKRLPSMEQQYTAIKTGVKDLFAKPVLLWAGFYLLEPYLIFGGDKLSPLEFWGDILKLEVIFSFSFYCAHRTFHEVNFLYVNIHKLHHSFHETVGFAGQYSHLIEEASNAFHVSIAAILIRPNMVTFIAFFGLVLFEVVDAHSGYSVPWRFLYPWSDIYPWGSGARIHDYHHSHNKGSYGGGLISFDKIFGTDHDFKAFETKRVSQKAA